MNCCKYKHSLGALLCTILLVSTFLIGRHIFFCPVRIPAQESSITFIESDEITSIKQFIPWPDQPLLKEDRSFLLIFDIDNTIAEPAGTQLGSDQWFCAKIEQYQQEGKSFDKAAALAVDELIEIHKDLKLQPIEPQTVPFINELQKRNFTVIALTARSCNLIERTIEQLQEIGINFMHDATFKNNFSFCAPKPACYKNGMIFTGPNDKGEVLKTWLDYEKYTPKEIVFIDDKMYNLQAVGNAAKSLGIPFVGIRYKRLDKKVKAFNLEEYEQDPTMVGKGAYPF